MSLTSEPGKQEQHWKWGQNLESVGIASEYLRVHWWDLLQSCKRKGLLLDLVRTMSGGDAFWSHPQEPRQVLREADPLHSQADSCVSCSLILSGESRICTSKAWLTGTSRLRISSCKTRPSKSVTLVPPPPESLSRGTIMKETRCLMTLLSSLLSCTDPQKWSTDFGTTKWAARLTCGCLGVCYTLFAFKFIHSKTLKHWELSTLNILFLKRIQQQKRCAISCATFLFQIQGKGQKLSK